MSSPSGHEQTILTSSDTASPTPELSDAAQTHAPSDPLASGIRALLDPTIKQTTEKLWDVHQSQQALSAELERLISQLQHYLETTDPPALKPTVIKLAATSKRLTAVNNSLSLIQQRVNKLYVQLSKQRVPSGPA
ncbi:hypothetical protein RUND412_005334 [Rhizina undulata]